MCSCGFVGLETKLCSRCSCLFKLSKGFAEPRIQKVKSLATLGLFIVAHGYHSQTLHVVFFSSSIVVAHVRLLFGARSQRDRFVFKSKAPYHISIAFRSKDRVEFRLRRNWSSRRSRTRLATSLWLFGWRFSSIVRALGVRNIWTLRGRGLSTFVGPQKQAVRGAVGCIGTSFVSRIVHR